jgi:hypothetical protein
VFWLSLLFAALPPERPETDAFRARLGLPRRVPLARFYADPRKLDDTIRDVVEGRRSFSGGQPLVVSRLDTPKGSFYTIDGHHRLVEAIERGDAEVEGVIAEFLPRIERTGGAHRDMVARKVRALEYVRQKMGLDR